ncbi:hypothetical protein GOODEAATRI_004890 [Goodea atripinnis]|uniref:Uncharacterized protein n=1 Tax=Goodea atripinnis TaxID=208336 RepID=A0ABV0P510_9TELE
MVHIRNELQDSSLSHTENLAETEQRRTCCSCLRTSGVRRQNMKVRINATGDTIVMKFVRPSPDVKLEGYILGYGRSMFSKQFIQLPENGQLYETELGKDTTCGQVSSSPGVYPQTGDDFQGFLWK